MSTCQSAQNQKGAETRETAMQMSGPGFDLSGVGVGHNKDGQAREIKEFSTCQDWEGVRAGEGLELKREEVGGERSSLTRPRLDR
jgi:hypothetical protein